MPLGLSAFSCGAGGRPEGRRQGEYIPMPTKLTEARYYDMLHQYSPVSRHGFRTILNGLIPPTAATSEYPFYENMDHTGHPLWRCGSPAMPLRNVASIFQYPFPFAQIAS